MTARGQHRPDAVDAGSQASRRASFVERLMRRCEQRQSSLCAGIDPSPAALDLLDRGQLGTRTLRAAAIERLGAFIVEAARDRAVAVKLQAAWFEHAGPPGMVALGRIADYARSAGLLVLLDGKRGDVPHSARAYAEAWLGDDAASGIACDAITANALPGEDSIEALMQVARARSCQVFVLVHTSNPGAAALQASPTDTGAPWWHGLARIVERTGAGAVIGATQPQVFATARELMPVAPVLVPGFGAQGGDPQHLRDLAAPGAPPPMVAASRALLPPVPTASSAEFRQHVATCSARLADVSTRAQGGTLGGFGKMAT